MIDLERLLAGTGMTARISAELDAERQALSQENQRIQTELEAEEVALTEQRGTLSAEEFRLLADAFDEKVQAIRAEQAAKVQELEQRGELERQNFLAQISPIIQQVMRERGGEVLIDRRALILPAPNVDITDEAIQRIQLMLDNAPEPADPTDPSAPTQD